MRDMDQELNSPPFYVCAKSFQDLFQKILVYIQNQKKQTENINDTFEEQKMNLQKEIQMNQIELENINKKYKKELENQRILFSQRMRENEEKYNNYIQQINAVNQENKKLTSELNVNKLSYQALESKLKEFQNLSFSLGDDIKNMQQKQEQNEQIIQELQLKNELQNQCILQQKKKLKRLDNLDLTIFEDVYDRIGINELIDPIQESDENIQKQLQDIQQKIIQKLELQQQLEEEEMLQKQQQLTAKKKKKQQLGVSNSSNNMKRSSRKQSIRSNYGESKKIQPYNPNLDLGSTPISSRKNSKNRRETIQYTLNNDLLTSQNNYSKTDIKNIQINYNKLQVSVSDLAMEKSTPFVQQQINEIKEELD
ncbi:hypothetical protein PPERSA_08839 [Pseudocohnilembus persalinus]|uniref:Uncharacterized protein n=1 Tax=Pseudocohnilembus persalinus TaxID=266149 RepID=A0A0V0R3Q5_PSEPJ|nr:hypothetical protein PPERSA_08839 [Pseudocohnilembus persalinus]|eukprot:KRX09123.1 hypothetical protein PPERSA_08839 [Pseudocohnilembus persalinus]